MNQYLRWKNILYSFTRVQKLIVVLLLKITFVGKNFVGSITGLKKINFFMLITPFTGDDTSRLKF
jgi:hypothetical protein